MEKVKFIWNWLCNNIKFVLFVIFSILFVCLFLWWGGKNRKIRELEQQLAIMQARLKIEKLTIEYNMTLEQLKKFKEQDAKVQQQLSIIESSLSEKLKPDMTAEEIAEKFKELGL